MITEMTLNEWISQLPSDWMEREGCLQCGDEEEWDFNLCISCAEEMNADEW